jgi:4-hydroxybenzoate polyprenyltransferase
LLFTTVLTLLGGLIAYGVRDESLDWRLFAVLVANLAAMAYAFMINDIEDAEDDAHEAARGSRNPITTGEVTRQQGWMAAVLMVVVALVGYWLGGINAFVTGVVILVLAHLYSWKPIRLKALPLVDILSHASFLAMLLFLAAFFIYSTDIGEIWILAIGTFLISAYGQLWNQVRDYEADRAAGLKNTASVLGQSLTQMLAHASIFGFLGTVLISIYLGFFPLWLAFVLLIATPIVLYLGRHNTTDMRGSETEDFVGKTQEQWLIVFILVLLAWLIEAFL